MRVVAGEARQVNLSAAITASSSQTTLAAVQTTLTPSGGASYTYAGALSVPTGSGAALDSAVVANPTFTPDVAGTYIVTLTATDISGATVTKVRTQEVGTAALSVSITAIGNSATLPTSGTEALACTPSGAIGSVTYAWTVTDPSGASVTPADATAQSTTVAYTATQQPGLWIAVIVVTDAAGRTARAVESWTTGGLPTANTPRAIRTYMSAGVLYAQEQYLVGAYWVDTGSAVAFTTETSGATLSGTTYTIPAAVIVNTTPHSSSDERYVAFTSFSSAFQALVAAGAQWRLSCNVDAVEANEYARIGFAVTSAAGSFDTAAENLLHARLGYESAVYRLQIAAGSGSFNNATTSASLGPLQFGAQVAANNTGEVYWAAPGYATSFSPGTTTPTRFYITGGAQTASVVSDTDFTNPTARLAFYPAVLS